MYERSTDHRIYQEGQEVFSSGKASDSEGMGTERKWGGSCSQVSDSSSYPVSVEEDTGARGRDLFERQEEEGRSQGKGTGRGEPQVERSPCHPDPGVDVAKKKDELGLSNRRKGCTYSGVQRQRIIEEVQKLKASGISKKVALSNLGVCRSTYYSWLKHKRIYSNRVSVLRLTDAEREAVIEKKKRYPHLSHRQISGYLRHDGYWISESSCYRIREAPWKEPRYEPFASNQIWAEDWTMLTIKGLRYYLLTIAWSIVKTVSQQEVKDLLFIAYISQGIENLEQKPMIRLDKGSPNMAYGTRRLIKDLEMVMSPSRVNRPTDNARQERWYRTVKQEEIYCYPTYPSLDIARQSIARYIEEYNERRPHQALWNYTPGYVHRLGNKTKLLQYHRKMVQIAKKQRIKENKAIQGEKYGSN